MRTTWAVVVGLAALASRSDADITLELRIDAALRDDVAVHVAVKNLGDEPAEGALPSVSLLGTTVEGDAPAALPPGFSATWDLALPRPTALGTLPIVVQLRYADAFGRHMSAPAVHLLRTAGTPEPRIALALEVPPLVDRGTATVRIENREDAPVRGTLRLVPSAELDATPTERPIEVAPGATLTVPVALENRTALEGSATALWAYATLERASWVDTLAAGAAVAVVPPAAERDLGATPAIALAAMGAIAFALWGIRRLLAAPAAARTRADRRRARR